MEAEFREIDESENWNAIYQEIRQQSSELPCKVAKLPENRSRNRYRDVSPFDHSRIHLQLGSNDYINASLISMEEARRSYILTQGPLPTTCGHFWEMVWEQRTRGVVMLNRVIEKGSVKCAQYWPQREEREAIFEDTNFKLTLVSEDVKSYYTVRQLELENLSTQETREILHFHYTTWPDFGVPESPASFLNFLFKVRESGCLNSDQGPVVVHCSAGIGRSGTFCLVDTCLLLMSLRKDPSSVQIKDVLLEMRGYRMGLIQTADQLRFSYLAVIEGAKCIMGDTSIQESWKELSNEEDPPPEFTPPPRPRPPKPPYNGPQSTPQFFPEDDIIQAKNVIYTHSAPSEPEFRRRTVATLAASAPAEFETPTLPTDEPDDASAPKPSDPVTTTTEAPPKPSRSPPEKRPVGQWNPLLVSVCLCTLSVASVVALGTYCYRTYFH
ncbi:tyrosine-protein phosphatase non-receptor type 1 isoform X1 [Ictalurus punctatus]|uniref:Tyrosine-protein phosphatase non-receptor type n=1 Tax=Ictalurus punctatus TaxID=7998 RepID=A0A2D0QZL0_ICTPU|nr:tyrosine-protein phosphatase non-receptor type 1 isoform X1 [Ictalurus punctatus]XP_017323195.1 tyrosine-protein phosphatase non-receptor type 1 isoform X1 [Ictalurus punctatus]XP_017323196.1 tyrosine-protein phosphatase non-receptor type 1 isoform X1 [Ictalurus punctatus]